MVHATSEQREPTAGPLTLHGLSVEGVNQCVHCGLCLAYCPTFSELGTEMDSPRGRIFLIKSLAEGRIAKQPELKFCAVAVEKVAAPHSPNALMELPDTIGVKLRMETRTRT